MKWAQHAGFLRGPWPLKQGIKGDSVPFAPQGKSKQHPGCTSDTSGVLFPYLTGLIFRFTPKVSSVSTMVQLLPG